MQEYPMFNNKGESQMDTNTRLDKIVNEAKMIALYDLKKKITEEIEALEKKNEEIEKQRELPF